MTKTDKKAPIRYGLQVAGYGRGYSKDYIRVPKGVIERGTEEEEVLYNDFCFETFEAVSEISEEGDEVDAYVYKLSPVPWSREGFMENVIVKLSYEDPKVWICSRNRDPIEIDPDEVF